MDDSFFRQKEICSAQNFSSSHLKMNTISSYILEYVMRIRNAPCWVLSHAQKIILLPGIPEVIQIPAKESFVRSENSIKVKVIIIISILT